MVRWQPLARTAGELLAFLAIIVGGATLVGWANEAFTGAVGVVATVGLFIAIVAAALGLLWLTGPQSWSTPESTLAGVGGTLGFLTVAFFLDVSPALGAAVGAGVGAIAGIGARRARPFAGRA